MADGSEVATALLLTALYVATITVCLVVQAAQRRHHPALEGDEEMQTGHKNSATSIESTPRFLPRDISWDTGTILAGLKYIVGICLVLAYAWACDRSGTSLGLENRSKRFEPAVAVCATLVVLCAYLGTFEPQPRRAGFLGSAQTDEWKGWMQIFLVFYHYLFPSPQPLAVYVAARIVVASFLFMTGYGRTMSAITSAARASSPAAVSFSFFTFCSMMIRLNLFVVLLAGVMGRQFCDYYFSPLVTFWSLFFYALHTLGSNYSATVRIGLAAVVCALLSLNGARRAEGFSFARLLFQPVAFLVSSPATSFDTWLFRSQLDCFSPLLGAVVALYSDGINAFFDGLHAPLVHAPRRGVMMKSLKVGAVLCAVCVVLSCWLGLVYLTQVNASHAASTCIANKGCRQYGQCAQAADVLGCVASRKAQEDYNYKYHAVLSAIPVLCFVTIRNLTPWLRERASSLIAFWGQRSLEIYLLQYHVWLSRNASKILVVIPDAPLLNACVVFAGFLAASDVAHRCTSGLAGLLLTRRFELPGSTALWTGLVCVAYAVLAVRAYVLAEIPK